MLRFASHLRLAIIFRAFGAAQFLTRPYHVRREEIDLIKKSVLALLLLIISRIAERHRESHNRRGSISPEEQKQLDFSICNAIVSAVTKSRLAVHGFAILVQ